MRKYSLFEKDIALDGIQWRNTESGMLQRLPSDLEACVASDLWDISFDTSGGRIRFSTNSALLGIEAVYHKLAQRIDKTNKGQMGIDLYVDGIFWMNLYPESDGHYETILFRGLERKRREITLYLPIHCGLSDLYVLVENDSVLWPAAEYKKEEPIIFYGSSITQGIAASRPGLTYPAQLCREMDLDFYNFGFSATGRGEVEVARAIAAINAACYIIDFGQNCETIREFGTVFKPFIDIVRNRNPITPIILTTPILYASEKWEEGFMDYQEAKRNVVRDVFRTLKNNGDNNLYLLEWNNAVEFHSGDLQSDGCHPNDIGFLRMKNALKELIEAII